MWRFAAARATGTSHIRANLPCQDRFACDVGSDGSFIAALADGAGSAEHAAVGAELSVASVLRHSREGIQQGRNDYDQLLREAAACAREAVLTHAAESGLPPRGFASTLLAVVCTPAGCGAIQLGDGVIVLNDAATEWCWVFWPHRGEYANTTHFLTDEDALVRLESELVQAPITDIALMSDGLEPLALQYAESAVYEPFFNGMFAPLHASGGAGELPALSQALQQFLSSDRIAARTDDDVSLVVATRRERLSIG